MREWLRKLVKISNLRTITTVFYRNDSMVHASSEFIMIHFHISVTFLKYTIFKWHMTLIRIYIYFLNSLKRFFTPHLQIRLFIHWKVLREPNRTLSDTFIFKSSGSCNLGFQSRLIFFWFLLFCFFLNKLFSSDIWQQNWFTKE